ncbi:glutamate 5-kinase [Aurantiacibacter gangjinensis]|uniref:Glutamate 5-kinase n=1 Tax=Aurantiacibacter gangjinensis TaxID=502682 RepID=A0A0G9MRV3_9SPHN|nr:glutamate 5-kinase [Aurantiacibacter gangjinensis]APE26993.1 Glutamate 5-kinase / RNA-binding C-terminal domain PUA [Aurantiacibacter gangjinensis]KLE33440.1 glutamate 5-kinase [Aurantiacibacter gangjinensis]
MAIDRLSDLRRARRIVVKIGSALIVGEGHPKTDWLHTLASDLKSLRDGGTEVVVVSSGAIALGAGAVGLTDRARASLSHAQAAAAAGQIALARLWHDALAAQGLGAAQVLLTMDDLEDRRRYLNASATLGKLLEQGLVPVVNENDTVATEEIRFGDNDRLAARVAQASGADAVLLLSDVDGLYDREPSKADAELVSTVDGVTPDILAMASSASSSGLGSGGMVSKLQAAQIAERAGIALAIINGRGPSPIARAMAEERGTLFLPRRADGARKAWLGGRLAAAGAISVDAGCGRALLDDGASLLAAGITRVDGEFSRGDLVEVRSEDGTAFARGLSEYDAADIRKIAGLRESEQAEQLGYAPRSAVIHRDHMVLL